MSNCTSGFVLVTVRINSEPDCLQKVRDLRSKGVIVYFEKENISTDDTKIEMMLTIFASMAQEESKSISENVKWGVRKRMAKGERKINAKHLMGYQLDENDNLIIIKDEAETVKKIFNLYISGYSYREICDFLNESKIQTKTGRDKWTVTNIHAILSNEKYCGDVILQKTVVVDFLTHKTKKNDGIEPKYLIQHHHEPIIPKQQFEYVQELRKFNLNNYSNYMNSNSNILAGLIYCENCLRPLYRIKQHPNKAYQRYAMTCKNQSKKNVNYIECDSSKTLDYEALIKASIDVFNHFFEVPKNIKETLKSALIGSNTVEYFSEKANEIKNEIACLENRLKDIISLQIKSSKHDEFKEEFKSVKKQIDEKKYELEFLRESTFKSYTEKNINEAIEIYINDKSCIEPALFRTVVKKIISMKNGTVRFVIGTTNFDLNKSIIMRIKNQRPIYSSKIKSGNFEIIYDVIKEDSLYD
jgi:L-rhamnose mutarotase